MIQACESFSHKKCTGLEYISKMAWALGFIDIQGVLAHRTQLILIRFSSPYVFNIVLNNTYLSILEFTNNISETCSLVNLFCVSIFIT